jgi:hypothetical protein
MAATPKFRSENLFRVIAKHRYPRKTAQEVAALTGDPVSTIYDWMRGTSEAPYTRLLALLGPPSKRS